MDGPLRQAKASPLCNWLGREAYEEATAAHAARFQLSQYVFILLSATYCSNYVP